MINFILGVLFGILSGFGIGGGSIFILYLTMVLGVSQIVSQGINLTYFVFSASPALFFHLKNKLVDKKAMVHCTISGIFSTIAFGFLANNIDTSILRKILGVILIIIGSKLVFTKKLPK